MGEVQQNGTPVGGLPEPDADESRIRSQNAFRIARRRQAAALSAEIGRVEASDLDRFGDTRQVGGTFEEIQAVPDRVAPAPTGLDLDDLKAFLQGLQFAPRDEVLGRRRFNTSFGPGILGLG